MNRKILEDALTLYRAIFACLPADCPERDTVDQRIFSLRCMTGFAL